MASARRSGTNEVIATYGDSSRDFQVGEFSTWEDATSIDLTAAGGNIDKATVINVTGARFITGEAVTFTPSNATGTFLGISRDDGFVYYQWT